MATSSLAATGLCSSFHGSWGTSIVGEDYYTLVAKTKPTRVRVGKPLRSGPMMETSTKAKGFSLRWLSSLVTSSERSDSTSLEEKQLLCTHRYHIYGKSNTNLTNQSIGNHRVLQINRGGFKTTARADSFGKEERRKTRIPSLEGAI
ncbi:hypothetical protein OSB04_013455 [Centaurea solstitialis]|uniref:Uncharacterized protein n=1 Tax=Centaurea solstitialis TaxID=347529 RepID=A0AA38TR84_9ASTR|nr:hypothetical protein OSB04_013455 [Centaurea solstitialis]